MFTVLSMMSGAYVKFRAMLLRCDLSYDASVLSLEDGNWKRYVEDVLALQNVLTHTLEDVPKHLLLLG